MSETPLTDEIIKALADLPLEKQHQVLEYARAIRPRREISITNASDGIKARIADMKRNPLFQHLDGATLTELAYKATPVTRKKGKRFYFQNASMEDGLYLLTKGSVISIFYDELIYDYLVQSTKVPEEKAFFVMRVIKSPQIFAMRAVVPIIIDQLGLRQPNPQTRLQHPLPRELRDGEVIAYEDSTILRWPGSVIVDYAHRNPSMYAYMLLFEFTRVDSYQDRITELINHYTSGCRAACNLLHIDKDNAQLLGGERVIPVNSKIFGRYIGTIKNTISRTLAYWIREGIISRVEGGIKINNYEALKAIADNPRWEIPEETGRPRRTLKKKPQQD